MADLVIRGGTVADGKGGELYEADIAVTDGRIVEVGKVSAKGTEEIDAKGQARHAGLRRCAHPL